MFSQIATRKADLDDHSELTDLLEMEAREMRTESRFHGGRPTHPPTR